MNDNREDLPQYLKWFMTFINRVGFPILVCCWLAYQQFVSNKEQAKAMSEMKEALITVNNTLEQQNRILRHKRGRDD